MKVGFSSWQPIGGVRPLVAGASRQPERSPRCGEGHCGVESGVFEIHEAHITSGEPETRLKQGKKKEPPARKPRAQTDLRRAYSSHGWQALHGLQALQGLHALHGLSPLVAPESVASSSEESEEQPVRAIKDAAVATTKRLLSLFIRYLFFSCGYADSGPSLRYSPRGKLVFTSR